MKPEFLIFKTGSYPQGNYPREIVEPFVNAFNVTKDQIPIVVGHRFFGDSDDDELAHGWIDTLRIDGAGKVFAVDYEMDDYAKERIAKGNLKKCSVEIMGTGSEDNPFAIVGLALLGRTAPQIAQTFLPALFGAKQRPGCAYLPAEDLDRATFSGAPAGAPSESEEDQPMTDSEKKDFEAVKASVSAIATTVGELGATVKAFAAQGQAAPDRKKDAESFFGAIRDAGKLAPAAFEKAVALDVSLDEAKRAEYRTLFSEAKPIVDTSGGHAASKDKASEAGGDAEELSVPEVRAFQKSHGITTFGEAAELLYASKQAAKKGEAK